MYPSNSNYNEFKESALFNLRKEKTSPLIADQDMHKEDSMLLKEKIAKYKGKHSLT